MTATASPTNDSSVPSAIATSSMLDETSFLHHLHALRMCHRCPILHHSTWLAVVVNPSIIHVNPHSTPTRSSHALDIFNNPSQQVRPADMTTTNLPCPPSHSRIQAYRLTSLSGNRVDCSFPRSRPLPSIPCFPSFRLSSFLALQIIDLSHHNICSRSRTIHLDQGYILQNIL